MQTFSASVPMACLFLVIYKENKISAVFIRKKATFPFKSPETQIGKRTTHYQCIAKVWHKKEREKGEGRFSMASNTVRLNQK